MRLSLGLPAMAGKGHAVAVVEADPDPDPLDLVEAIRADLDTLVADLPETDPVRARAADEPKVVLLCHRVEKWLDGALELLLTMLGQTGLSPGPSPVPVVLTGADMGSLKEARQRRWNGKLWMGALPLDRFSTEEDEDLLAYQWWLLNPPSDKPVYAPRRGAGVAQHAALGDAERDLRRGRAVWLGGNGEGLLHRGNGRRPAHQLREGGTMSTAPEQVTVQVDGWTPVLWLASPPLWTRGAAEAAGVPVPSVVAFARRARDAGWCKTRGPLLDDGPADLEFWMPDEVRREVVNLIRDRIGHGQLLTDVALIAVSVFSAAALLPEGGLPQGLLPAGTALGLSRRVTA